VSGIATITFNPCIDKSTTVASIIPEKKLRCSIPNFEPGGGGINVSRAIKKLGGRSIAIYPAGGYSGKFLTTLLKNEGIDSIVIETADHTRENLIILDTSTNLQYRFGMPGSTLAENEWKRCLQELEKLNDIDFIVASGSLSPGLPVNVFGQIAQIAKAKNIKLVIDTSGEALNYAIKEGVYLVKPNLGELASLVNKEELKAGEVLKSAQQLIDKGAAKILVVSLGPQGALLITQDQHMQFVPPMVKRKSTVGAGDSMVAGIILSLQKGKSIPEAVQYGVACGTAATMNAGTELCHVNDVENLFSQVEIAQEYSI
jgi:6-phosphofructokinase 2